MKGCATAPGGETATRSVCAPCPAQPGPDTTRLPGAGAVQRPDWTQLHEVRVKRGCRTGSGGNHRGNTNTKGEERDPGLPAGPAAAAPCARAGSGCRTPGSASVSAAAPSPPPPADPPAAPPSATRWPAGLDPAAGHYTAWPPAPGFSNATQITHRQAVVWIQQANDPPRARGEGQQAKAKAGGQDGHRQVDRKQQAWAVRSIPHRVHAASQHGLTPRRWVLF